MDTRAEALGLDAGSPTNASRHGLRHDAPVRGGEWDALRERVLGWSSLADGWDDEDSLVPKPDTLRDAADFAAKAKAGGIAPASVTVYGDGEVEFFWNKEAASASASFLSDGNVVAYVRVSPRECAFQLDQPYGDTKELSDLLAALRQAF